MHILTYPPVRFMCLPFKAESVRCMILFGYYIMTQAAHVCWTHHLQLTCHSGRNASVATLVLHDGLNLDFDYSRSLCSSVYMQARDGLRGNEYPARCYLPLYILASHLRV